MNSKSGKGFKVFHRSSEEMPELKDNSIDLIMGSPPYNIGTNYINFTDQNSFYNVMMRRIIWECERVLKSEGKLVIECADSTFSGSYYVQLAGMIQKICLTSGFHLNQRHINFVKTGAGVESPDHGFSEDYGTACSTHSNCHQVMVFSKNDERFRGGQIIYANYEHSDEHVCPTPKKLIDFVLDRHFKPGMKVLDPFMGIASLGVEVLRRGGKFYGYDVSREYFLTAARKLQEASKKSR